MSRSFIIFLLLTTNLAFGQVKISGKIIDNHNKTLPGISITILDSYDGATSDSLGNYSFTTIEKGEQTLQATSAGYKIFRTKNKFSRSTNIN